MSANIPFKAAIFDLDGTLLDSNGVWRDVDARFFGSRNIAYSQADYARAVQGMSFREAAEYTVRRFELSESVEAVMDEWLAMTREIYARHVPLKPGARDYLRLLKRAGVKLAVATANRAELFMPALERGGVAELFDAFCTSAEVGDTTKANGALFQLAARRLGVEAADCAVFEDVLEGVTGAKRAGMLAYAVRDAATEHSRAAIDALADGVVDDFTQMRGYHSFEEAPRRCVIFTAHCEGDPRQAYESRPGDYILCADGGWVLARQIGVRPDLVIGDFDSSEEPADETTVRVPVEKDDADTMLCLKRGLSLGFDDFLIVGGFGGRVDHTLANFQALHYAARRGVRAEMRDGESWATAIFNEGIRVPADATGAGPAKLSVFALTDVCRGVNIRGAKWTLKDAELTNAFPLGLSNAFAAAAAEISVREGALLVTVCEG
ncbi:MAG: thiamine diphosphokinase [Clostridia bacterium]|nr:thiamine diphosphokinase [Clostridia bacterium]